MMKTKFFSPLQIMLLAAALVSAGIALSCASLSGASIAGAAGVGAQIAGNLGVIDQNTAAAITQSSEAIGKAAEEITPEQEYYIGRAVGANILSSYKIYGAKPALTAYLNKICGAIVINSPKPDIYNGYHVNILDSAEINAFATSGGHIFITRGLIDSADSEDALAGVIAHEIAHIQLQHSIKAITNSRINQALMVTGISAVGVAAGMDVKELTDVFNQSVGEIVNTLLNKGYSREQEYDADATALSLLAAAGYSPSGLIDMLRQLEKTQGSHAGGFNKTHPSPAERLGSAEKLAVNYQVPDTRSSRQGRYRAAK
jgi:predicted Zn-dependent protease